MKKVLASLVVSMLTICCLFMVGCSPAGTYKFESMSYSVGGLEISIKAGQEYLGVTVTEDFAVLELKKDGTGIFTSQGESTEMTWEKDGDIIKLTADGETVEVKIDGDKLILEVDGTKLVLVK